MKNSLLTLAVAAALATTARASDYNPVALFPSSFNADVIVESNSPPSIDLYTTATVDGGTNKNANTLYPVGFNTTLPFSGIPAAGSTFFLSNNVVNGSPVNPGDTHEWTMPPDYTVNHCLFVGGANFPGTSSFVVHNTAGSLTNTVPTAGTTLSFIFTSSGNPSNTVSYVIHHANGNTDTGTFATWDWFNAAVVPAFLPRGRISLDNAQFNTLNSTTANKMMFQDVTLTETVSPVTSVDLAYVNGSGRSFFFGYSISPDSGVTWVPMTISGGFTHTCVMPPGAGPVDSILGLNNVSMDAGTNNTGNTFYEVGFDKAALASGFPLHGSTLTYNPTHSFVMPATYAGNDCVFIGNYTAFFNGVVTLASPTTCNSLSLLASAGNGPCVISYTVNHVDGGTAETGTISVADWFAGGAGFSTQGRFVTETCTFNNVNGGATKLWTNDIPNIRTDSPVTNINLSYSSGGRAGIFAVSTSTDGTNFLNPVGITSFDADAIVEASSYLTAEQLGPPAHGAGLRSRTTVSMDGGTANTGNTWFEQGYYTNFPNAGLPHPGQIITNLSDSTKHYQMPTNYTINNAIYVDSTHTNANLGIVSPQTYSALSFLNSCANGAVVCRAIMQYADGKQETNTFTGSDWFNNNPVVYTSRGRLSLDNRTFNSDPGRSNPTNNFNPRLYEAGFTLLNQGSVVTNIVVQFVSAGANGRIVILGVSATAGAVPPIWAAQPTSVNTNEGVAVSFSGLATATFPISYQWQAGVSGSGGPYTNLLNGSHYSGATSTNLIVSNVTWPNDALDYILIATDPAGSITSTPGTLTLISSLPVVTIPGDPIVAYQPSGGSSPAAETVDHAIDELVGADPGKYLNFGANGGAPYVGPTGFIVTPSKGSTIITVMRLYTANDTVGRDPADYEIDGSNDGGASWTTITTGSLNLPAGRNNAASALANPFTQFMQEVRFANANGYTTYRWFSTNDKDNTQNSMQIGEVELRGVNTPLPASIVAQTASDITNYVGGHPQVFVKATAFPTNLFYQWFTNGVPVPGANGPIYGYKPGAPGVQMSDDGMQFSCQVSNTIAPAAVSATITLHVIAAPTQSYPVAIMADNPLAWWRLDETDDGSGNAGKTANDFWGGHSGIYTNTQLGIASYNPTEDPDTAAAFGTGSTPSDVDQVQGFNFASPTNTSVALSVEAWIRGTLNQTAGGGIITYGYGGGGEVFGMDCGGAGTAVRFFFRDASGTSHNLFGTNLATVLDGNSNPTWHHVVAVLNEAATNQTLYWDGLPVAISNLNAGLGMRASTIPLTIGARSANAASGNSLQFIGDIDEAALYNTALTPARVLAHYYAAQLPPTLQIPLADRTVNEGANVTFASTGYGPGTVGYLWNLSTDGGATFNPTGGNTANLVVPSVTAAQSGNQFFVIVTNNYGSTTSRVATLTVVSGPPVVVSDLPATTVVYAGANASFTATFEGTQPISYQWYKNGNPMSDGGRISGSHTNSLSISNTIASDGALYQLGATNIFSAGSPTFTAPSSLYVEVAPDFNTNGGGWVLNGDTVNGGPVIANNTFTITDGSAGENRSAWYKFPQNIDSFQASWTYLDASDGGSADGVAFILQNDPRGTTALGGGGGGMGYIGITPSVAIMFNIYSGAPTATGSDVLFSTNGVGPSTFFPFTSTAPVNIASANPIAANVRYAGGVLTLTLQDTVALTTFSMSQVVNIPYFVGADTAYVGISGAEGGVFSSQSVANFVFISLPTLKVSNPSPGMVVLTWPSSVGGYQLQSASSLPPAWANDNTPVTIVGGNNQVTVSPANGKKFYRLVATPYP
jgi:hypothetical protein